MELKDLRRIVASRAHDWRAIDRTLQHQWFDDIHVEASDEERRNFEALAQAGDRDGVIRWCRDQRSKKLVNKTLKDLRVLARHACIPNFHDFNKDELVALLGGIQP